MPGSRLSHEDRQRIEAGLAGGLGYAEIARRLRRPTSTVSREVSRNGGYDGYRAENAQQATGRRARRVRETPPEHASAAVREFEAEFAAMMVRTGLTRMPAKVLVCLLTSEHGSLGAADLVHRLQVSPASVSKAVAYLEQIGLVRRERGRRRERYFTEENVWYQACMQEVRLCATWAGAARRGAEVLGDTRAGARLDQMSRYFEHVGHDLALAAERWREVFTAERP
jgi:hypothetical protein